jgi:cytochrome c-type biogenesis protein CcmF
MVGMLFIGFYFYYTRYKDMPWVKIDSSYLNRENALVASIYVLSASAFFILIGTSSPILTGLFGNPAQVDLSFYNKVNYPIAIVISLLLGIAPFLLWVEKDLNSIIKRLVPSLVLSVITIGSAYVLELTTSEQLLFIGSSAFAFWSNGIVLVKNSKISMNNISASLAHLGVGLMFIAIIVSGTMNEKQNVVLSLNNTKKALGYNLVYRGMTKVENGKNIANIKVSSGKMSYMAEPRLYFSKYNKSWMREPDVSASLIQDIYISPIQFSEPPNIPDAASLELKKGEKKKYADYDVLFTGFELKNHDSDAGMRVGANIEITKDDKSVKIKPEMLFTSGEKETFPVFLTGEQLYAKDALSVILAGINADAKSILLNMKGSARTDKYKNSLSESIVVEISHKPLMSILWLGTILMTIGSILAFRKRIKINPAENVNQ